MKEKMLALEQLRTGDLVNLSPGKKVAAYRWVYTMKLNLDRSLDRLKARLVTKGYFQVYSMDYQDTFSPVAKLTSVWILISFVVPCH